MILGRNAWSQQVKTTPDNGTQMRKRTRCANNHQWTEVNTRWSLTSSGYWQRDCLICIEDRNHKKAERAKATVRKRREQAERIRTALGFTPR